MSTGKLDFLLLDQVDFLVRGVSLPPRFLLQVGRCSCAKRPTSRTLVDRPDTDSNQGVVFTKMLTSCCRASL
eukprot:4620357-Prorocentrum_lima.AAC.1